MNNFKDKFLNFLTYSLLFLMPLVYFGTRLYPHVTLKTFFLYGMVEAITATWIYAVTFDKSYWLPKKAWLFFVFPTLFILWMSLAGLLGANPTLSLWSSLGRGTGLLTLYHCLALSVVIASLVKRNSTAYVYKLFQWFFAGATILAVSVWFGNEGFNAHLYFLQISGGGGLIGNSSFAAAYLLFAIAIGIFLIVSKNIKRAKKYWIAVGLFIIIFSPLFINLYGVFVGNSILGSARGALLGIFVMLGFAFLFYLVLSSKKTFRIIGVSAIILSVCVFSIIWVRLMTPNTVIHNKFAEVASPTRFLFWGVASKVINEHPYFGYGPENFMIAFQQNFDSRILLPEYHHEGWDDRAHNIIYDVGVSGGYPAIVLYALFLLSILYCIFMVRKSTVFTRVQISILFGLLFGYFFQNLFIFDSASSLMILFVFAGIIYSLQNNEEKNKKNTIKQVDPFYKNGLLLVLFILFIISFRYFSYLPAKKSSEYSRVFSSPINKPFKELLKGSAVGTEWDVSGMAYDAYKVLVADPTRLKNNKEVLPYALKDITGMLEYLEIIAQNNKTDARLYISMADLFNTRTFFTDIQNTPAETTHLLGILETAHNLMPKNPEVYWIKAQVYAWSGDLENVVKSYKDGIALDPTLKISHDMFLKFLKSSENQKGFDEALKQAQSDIPGFVFTN